MAADDFELANRRGCSGHAPDTAAYLCREEVTPLAVSVQQFCRLTSVGRTTTFALIRDGELESRHVRGRTVILWRSIEALLRLQAGKEQ